MMSDIISILSFIISAFAKGLTIVTHVFAVAGIIIGWGIISFLLFDYFMKEFNRQE